MRLRTVLLLLAVVLLVQIASQHDVSVDAAATQAQRIASLETKVASYHPPTPTQTRTPTRTATATATRTATATSTALPTITETAMPTETATPTLTPMPTWTLAPTQTPEPTPTEPFATPVPSRTATSVPSATPTVAPTATPAAGLTYYVDAVNGSDSNAGISPDAAWHGIVRVNSAQFAPGVSVLFRRGCTWSGTTLQLSTSGAADRPIVFGAYGEGARPVIAAGGQTQAFYAGASRGNYKLAGLDLRGGTFTVECPGYGVTIEDCNVQDASRVGILFFGLNIHDVVIRGNTVHDCLESGVEIGADSQPGPTNFLIEDNICWGNGTGPPHHGIYVKRSTNVVIRRNVCYSNAGAGIKARFRNVALLIDNNECYSNDGYGITFNVTEDIVPGNIIVSNNLLHGNNYYNLHLAESSQGVEVYHNTLINAVYRGLGLDQGAETGNTFKNNLIVQDVAVVGAGRVPLRIYAASQSASNVFDGNCYAYIGGDGRPVDSAGTGLTLAQWQAQTGSPDLHSISADPLFVAPYKDLHLRAGSPCIDAGVNVGVTTDADGRVRDARPDVGAYEY